MKKFVLGLIVLVLATMACQTLVPSAEETGSQPAGNPPVVPPPQSGGQPAGNPPVVPPPQSGGQPAGEDVIFEDDFSSSTTGWDVVDLDYKTTNYTNDAFRIWVNKAQLDVWSTLNRDMGSDVIIEVEATKVAGPDVNDFGVICRFAEDKSSDSTVYYFYYFLISSDGNATIAKVDANSQTYMTDSGNMEPASAIRKGNATNQIRAECVGNTLTLIVNGQKVSSVTDPGLGMAGGDVGMIAGTFDPIGVDISFDNYRVLRP